MEVKVVLGLAFGDEGKGVTVQNLVREAQNQGKSVAVVRFSGGPQAAHTVQVGDKKHICSTYGAGVLLGAPTYLLEHVYFDPYCANNERKALEELGIKDPELYVSVFAKWITPWDVFFDRSDNKVLGHGSCGKGIHATFVRNQHGVNYTVAKEWYAKKYGFRSEEADSFKMDYHNAHMELHKHGMRTFHDANLLEKLKQYDVVVCEGSQGLLLDMDYGFYPYVTPSHTGLDNIKDSQIPLENAEVYLVTRSYMTRHGNGFEPRGNAPKKYIESQIGIETNIFNNYQGNFKVGAFDIPILSAAWNRHHMDVWINKYKLQCHLVITHADAYPRMGGPDKGVAIVLSERYVLGGEPVPHIGYTFDPYDAFLKLPFCNMIWKVFYNTSPEGNLTEITNEIQ